MEQLLMAKMATCKTCGADVAASASSCPSCGAHRTRVGNAVAFAGLIVVIVGFVLLVIYAVDHYQS
jgi:presenilin-like A22 family membrane protease